MPSLLVGPLVREPPVRYFVPHYVPCDPSDLCDFQRFARLFQGLLSKAMLSLAVGHGNRSLVAYAVVAQSK